MRTDCRKQVAIFLSLTLMLTAGTVGAQENKAVLIVKPGAPGEASKQLTPKESIALGRVHHTDEDARFMQHMIVHHAQAVDMSELIEDRTDHHGITMLGKRITLSQDAEIKMMRTWLKRRGRPLEDISLHAHHGAMMDPDKRVMTGMLAPNEMKALAAADGSVFEKLYLTGMIKHHQGAITMVEALMSKPGNGEDPEHSEFLAAVIADQSGEILRMQSMLSALGQNNKREDQQ